MIQSQLQQRMAEAGASVCLMLAATLFFQTLRFRTEGNFEMDGRRRHLKSKEIPGFLIQGKDQEGFKERYINDFIDKVHGVKDGKVERKVQPNKDNSSANKCLHTEDISPVNQTNDCLSADSLETALKVPAKKSNPLKKRSSCKIPNKQNKDRGMSQSKTFKVSAKMSAPQKKCKTRKNPAKENGDCAIPKSKNLTGSDLSDMESELSDESNDNGATGALKVPAKKSNPPKKCISRKIPDKENEDRGMPQSKKSVSRVSWTEEEKDAVFKHLSSFVRQGRFPGKRDCENCIPKSNGALERRDWRAVKYFVKNQVDKRKRVLAPKNS